MKCVKFPEMLKKYLGHCMCGKMGKCSETHRLESLEPRVLMSGNPIITEFMADNDNTLDDGDGNSSDWIEIRNAGTSPIDLEGYHLTDDPLLIDQWTFPSVVVQPGEHLVVFASGQDVNDYVDGEGNLHTNFGLNAGGDYLAFAQPDNTLINEFAVGGADYPDQKEDVSYGTAYTTEQSLLIDRGSSTRYLIPGAANELPVDWNTNGFDDSGWSTGTFGLGFDQAETFFANIAAQGTASQSTTLSASYTANNAINGNFGDFTHTQGTDAAPFWEVAFDVDHALSSITLHNRDSCCQSRLRDITVTIRDAADTTDLFVSGLLNAENTGFAFPAGPDSITLDLMTLTGGVVDGGIVRIERTADSDLSGTGGQGNDDEANVLSLGEVEIFAQFMPDEIQEVAVGKPSTQSSTGFALPASNGNDGNPATESHTSSSDSQSTWEVDLQGTFAISQIDLFNRDDCCQSRMRDLLVSILAADRTEIWTSDLLNPENSGFVFPAGPGQLSLDVTALAGMPIAGAYVQVQRIPDPDLSGTAGQGNADESNVLSLGEVNVYGLPAAPFSSFIGTDIESEMKNVNSSVFTRTAFNVDDPGTLAELTLNLQADDGYIVYLNGTEVLTLNAPESPVFDSSATQAVDGESGLTFASHDLTQFISLLVSGQNTLAIQGLNVSANDEDFLLQPTLTATTITDELENAFMLTPTPGSLNTGGVVGFVSDTNFTGPERGYHTEAFDLTITTDTPGATIIYTTDGSTPSETNGIQVPAVDEMTPPAAVINIAQTTVVRTIAVKENFEPTNVDTQSFFFLEDILLQSNDGSAPVNWPTTSVNSQVFDYGVDPQITSQFTQQELSDVFSSISTISLVTDIENLVDPGIGIYVNAQNRGRDWERPVSVEIINPDGVDAPHEQFQVDAGLRIRGGASRNPSFVKHSFRLFFRSEYGDAKLNVPLFGDEGASEFDGIDLRTSQNYDWARHSNFGTGSQNTFVREVFARDTQGATGQPYSRSTYYHLYLNGIYWGVYQSQERPEAGYGESYFGGDKDDYDVIKSSNHIGGFTTEATDGDLDAWNDFWTQANEIEAETDEALRFEKYMQIQGLNPDGTRNEAYPVHLDADNLIDYMLTIFYSGDGDAPLSSFLGNNRANNWFTLRNRESGDMGWKFFRHDAEHTHGTSNSQIDRTGPFNGSNENNFTYSNPQWIYQDLLNVEEFRVKVGDRIREHFFNAGAMTDQTAIDNFLKRADEVALAMIGQSARWGDAQIPNDPYTIAVWQNEIDSVVASDLPGRSQTVVDQLIADGLYPDFATPLFNVDDVYQHGGEVGFGSELSIVLDENELIDTKLIEATTSTLDALIPTDGSLDSTDGSVPVWAMPAFDSSGWSIQDQPNPVGFDESVFGGDYNDEIETDIAQMRNTSSSAYIRIPFNLTGQDLNMDALRLSMLFDDGFIAYLNGVEVARSASVIDTTPGYDTTSASHTANVFEDYDLSSYRNLLVEGENILAIHGVNLSAGSSDFLIYPELIASVVDDTNAPDVYYTTDGTDPRLLGGGINPNAMLYDGSFPLTQSAQIMARTLTDANEWSALNQALFAVDMPVRVSEIHYNPDGSDDTEFIELHNISGQVIDLTGIQFVQEDLTGEGIRFEFLDTDVNKVLNPGERIVIPGDHLAFTTAYPEVPVNLIADRAFEGSLSNGGEAITLLDAAGSVIQAFEYSDDAPFDERADGGGPSLDFVDTSDAKSAWNDAGSWRASGLDGGTPGRVDPVDGALEGDANYDGVVDLADLAKLATNFGNNSITNPDADVRWLHGDFTLDGVVDLADLAKLATNFGQSGSNGFPVGVAAAGAPAGLIAGASGGSSSPLEALMVNTSARLEAPVSASSWDHIDNLLDDETEASIL